MSERVILEVGGFRNTIEIHNPTQAIYIIAPTNTVDAVYKVQEITDLTNTSTKRWRFEYDHDAAGIKFYKFVSEE